MVTVLTLGAMVGMALPAKADLCASTTSCTLYFTQGNTGSGFGLGNFGTLTLNLTGNTVNVSVAMASGFYIINTGVPGAFGFSDGLGGGLTIGNFAASPGLTHYSGGTSLATSTQNFDGFGSFMDAAATTAPSNATGGPDCCAISSMSFDVSKGTAITDVEDILRLADPVGGDGAAYFVVDAANRNTSGTGAGNTGLIAVMGGGGCVPSPANNFCGPQEPPVGAPEPRSIALFGVGLLGLGLVAQRRRSV